MHRLVGFADDAVNRKGLALMCGAEWQTRVSKS